MATESNVHQTAGGIRTYRGRTLEEILPQIRAELGPDAIILREREGLVGGVGGFFAQRFVEVDARGGEGQTLDARPGNAPMLDTRPGNAQMADARPDDGQALRARRGEGHTIDIYDDTPEADMRRLPPAAAPEPAVARPRAILPPEPTEIGRRPTPEPLPPEPKPFIPRSVTLEKPAAPASRFETTVFMDRLREASATAAEDEPVAETATPSAPEKPARKPRPAAKPKPATKSKTRPSTAPAARTKRQPPSSWAAEIDSMPAPHLDTATARDLVAAIPPESEMLTSQPRPQPPSRPAREPTPRPARPQAPRPAREQPSHQAPRRAAREAPEPPLNPYENVRHRPRPVLPERATQPRAAAGTLEIPVAPPARPGTHGRPDDGLRSTLGRLVEGLRPTGPTKPAPAKPLDLVAATAVANELSTRGASQAWTSQLISAAGAHGSPLTGSLREAAEAEVARRIVPAPALPATGAAIAFIGAGGSGKTRCTAALASAYRRNSTLEVTVLALDNPDGARELRKLLRDDDVPVLSLNGARALRAVGDARNGGLVIVDTGTATPTDPADVRALGAKLAPLALDALYVTLPATLGPQAARRALASFGRLKPSAVAITHADETDQLAVVVEIAIAHRIPLAYFHSGTDHRTALSSVDPPTVAQQLLP